MKKLMFLSAVLLFLAVGVYAQNSEDSLKKEIKVLKKEGAPGKKMKKMDRQKLRKLEGADASFQSKQKFFSDFGDVPVTKWERLANYDEATFTKDGKVLNAFYDADANLVGTTSIKTFEDLPASAQKYINEKYNGYTKGPVVFYDDNEFNETDMILYGLQFDDADNYFVELTKNNKTIVLMVDPAGRVSFFKQLN